MIELFRQGSVTDATRAAEEAANEKGCPEWLDDDIHWIWDLALKAEEKAQD